MTEVNLNRSNEAYSENSERFYKSDHSIMEHLPNEWKIMLSILFLFVAVVSTFANAVVLRTLMKHTELHTKSNVLLAFLFLSDFCNGSIVAPLNAAQILNENGDILVPLFISRVCLSTIFSLASDYLAAFISVDRCLHILNLYNYELKKRTVSIALLLCWLCPMGSSLLCLFRYHEVFVYVINIEVWSLLLVILLFYSILIVTLRQYTVRRVSILDDNYQRNQREATHTVVIIVALYVLMRLPVMVSFLVTSNSHHSNMFKTKLYAVANLVSLSNSALNPVLYGYRTSFLREHLEMMWWRRWCISDIQNTTKKQASIEMFDLMGSCDAKRKVLVNL